MVVLKDNPQRLKIAQLMKRILTKRFKVTLTPNLDLFDEASHKRRTFHGLHFME